MSNGFFITGTDTHVGKTTITRAMMHLYADSGNRVMGMKPIASGCDMTTQGLRNDDALHLIDASSTKLEYEMVNPYAFQAAIAPHIAAKKENTVIDIQHLIRMFSRIKQHADITFIEGAGGWLVPINEQQTLADFAIHLGLPVILVVGVKLGCINHALLSQLAINNSGLTIAGWVANRVDPECLNAEENISYLTDKLDAPLLGVCPYLKTTEPQLIKNHLSASQLNNY